MIRECSE
jgi:hypothetical protein